MDDAVQEVYGVTQNPPSEWAGRFVPFCAIAERARVHVGAVSKAMRLVAVQRLVLTGKAIGSSNNTHVAFKTQCDGRVPPTPTRAQLIKLGDCLDNLIDARVSAGGGTRRFAHSFGTVDHRNTRRRRSRPGPTTESDGPRSDAPQQQDHAATARNTTNAPPSGRGGEKKKQARPLRQDSPPPVELVTSPDAAAEWDLGVTRRAAMYARRTEQNRTAVCPGVRIPISLTAEDA